MSSSSSHLGKGSKTTQPAPPPPLPHAHITPAPPSHPTSSFSSADEKSPEHIVVDINPLEEHSQQPQNPLSIFHNALGIPPPTPPKPLKNPSKTPAKEPTLLTPGNKGVYACVVSNERWSRAVYYFTDFIITVSMFLQIVVGASVTAFGAGQSNHVIITVFGAANTALASLLAVLKSQGLPNRLRQDWNGWRELREYIEEKEREIEMVVSGKVQVEGRGDSLDVWKEVRGIEARYQAVRLTSEANRPDTYIKVPALTPS